MGAYATRSQPPSNHAAVILPASARSVTPGLAALIITRCASMDAAAAFLSSAISPASFTTRNCCVKVVASRVDAFASWPSVTAVKPISALAWADSG